jgi:hypothetical protein
MNTPILVLPFALLVSTAPALAGSEAIGAVDKVQNVVTATRAGGARDLQAANPLFYRDALKTGPGARFEGKLDDGTVLTLGEKGKLTIDEFVYKPGAAGGKLALTVAQGPFLFVGGKIEAPSGGNVDIKTPVGTLGVRGTTVWGGKIDGGFGVLVLKGEVWLKTKNGVVDLKEGSGTMVYAGKAPTAPAPWPQDRTQRAVATVSFP